MAGQLGVWHAQQLDPDNPIYNMAEYIEIRGTVDARLFEKAVRTAVSEIDCFALRFEEDPDGTPRQYAAPSTDWPFHTVDLSETEDPRARAAEWMRADLRRPVDLRGGELFTEALLKIEDGLFFWYQRIHHIIADGLAGSRIAAHVAAVYTALRDGTPSPAKPSPRPPSSWTPTPSTGPPRTSHRTVSTGRNGWPPPRAIGLSGREPSGTPAN